MVLKHKTFNLEDHIYNLDTINAFWSVLKMYLLYIYSIDILGTDWKSFMVFDLKI